MSLKAEFKEFGYDKKKDVHQQGKLLSLGLISGSLVSNKARIGFLSFQWVCSHSVHLIPQSLTRFLLNTQERKGKKNSQEPEAKETLESELGLG